MTKTDSAQGQRLKGEEGMQELSAAIVSGGATETLAARAVQVTKVYGQGQTAVWALDNVSVVFPAGRFTAIMAPPARASRR